MFIIATIELIAIEFMLFKVIITIIMVRVIMAITKVRVSY